MTVLIVEDPWTWAACILCVLVILQCIVCGFWEKKESLMEKEELGAE